MKAAYAILPAGAPEANLRDDRIVLVSADSEMGAFRRALDIALAWEREYESADGRVVRVRLMAIERVFRVSERELDGAEVFGELSSLNPNVGFDAEFDPRSQLPDGV